MCAEAGLTARDLIRHDGDMSNLADKKLERPRKGRLVAGVAAGLAEYFDVDATLVRLAFALVACIGGIGILMYLAGWLLIPEEGETGSILERLAGKIGS
jgi:phage shock protein PspC (stress-responsive transcriptional regulator)